MNSILQGISYVKLPEELCNSMKGLINSMYIIAQPDKKFVMKDYIKVEDQKVIYKNLYVSDHEYFDHLNYLHLQGNESDRYVYTKSFNSLLRKIAKTNRKNNFAVVAHNILVIKISKILIKSFV